LRRYSTRNFAAISRIERAAIISIDMMSRGRHSPAGHGSGKFVLDSVALRMPRVLDLASCSFVTVDGVIKRALAASERIPIEL